MKGYWSQKDFPSTSFPALVCSFFFPNPHGYSKPHLEESIFYLQLVQPISLNTHNSNIPSNVGILSWILMSPLQRYTQSNIHKNQQYTNMFSWYCCARCYILCAFCATSFCYVGIYIYINQNSIVYHNVQSYSWDLMWCFCVQRAHTLSSRSSWNHNRKCQST